MTSFVLTPQMREMIIRAKTQGGTATCDPRAMYPVGHVCAGSTQPIKAPFPNYIKLRPPIDAGGVPVPPDAKITNSVPTSSGGAVTEIETPTETVVAKTDANGNVEKVAVKEKNVLIPLALAAAAFILLGG